MRLKACTVILCLLGAALIFNMSVFAKSSDINNHWAEKQILKWTDNGLINGYGDGIFKPDSTITRSEFLALINRVIGYKETAKINFSDVSEKDWFALEVSKAVAAGYISGYVDGTIKPGKGISRQEAAVMVCKVLNLDLTKDSDLTNRFKDVSLIPEWSKAYINTIAANGYMHGYPDGTFMADKPITRAEAVAILDNAIGTLYNDAGAYGPAKGVKTIDGNVTADTSGIAIRNTKINGNLFLTEGVGDGSIELDNVVVTGKTLIKGGGMHSIVIKNSTLDIIIVDKKSGDVRLVAVGNTNVKNITLVSGAKLEEAEVNGSGFQDVSLSISIPAGETVQFDGSFDNVNIEATGIKVDVLGGAIDKINASKEAKGTVIDLGKTVSVNTVTLNSAVDVSGEGKIDTAVVNVKGATIAQSPANVVISVPGVSVEVGNSEVKETKLAGKSDNSNQSQVPQTPVPPVSPGGSGSSGGNNNSENNNPGNSNPTPVNHSPVAKQVPDKTGAVGGTALVYDAADLATDSDNDTLTVSNPQSSDAGVASGAVQNGNIVVTPVSGGSANITVTVSDSNGGTADVTFKVNIITEPDLVIQSATGINSRTVEVVFNSNIDQTLATNTANYQVKEKYGSKRIIPMASAKMKLDGSGNIIGNSVTLTVSAKVNPATLYAVTVSNLKSLYGKPINPLNNMYTFVESGTPTAEDADSNLQVAKISDFTILGNMASWTAMDGGDVNFTGATGYEIYYINVSQPNAGMLPKDTPGAGKIVINNVTADVQLLNLDEDTSNYMFAIYAVNGRTYSMKSTFCAQAPNFLSIASTSNTTVDITFDKEVDISSAVFNIKEAYGESLAVTASTLSADKKIITLSTASQGAKLYKADIDEVKSLQGIPSVEIMPLFVGKVPVTPPPPVPLPGAVTSFSAKLDSSDYTKLILDFDQDVDEASGADINNYSIDGGVGTPISASVDSGSDKSIVNLKIPITTPGRMYTIDVSNLPSRGGVSMVSPITAHFAGNRLQNNLPSIEAVIAVDSQTLKIYFDRTVDDCTIDGKVFNSNTNTLTANALQLSKDNGNTFVPLNTYTGAYAYKDPDSSAALVVRVAVVNAFKSTSLTNFNSVFKLQGLSTLVKSDGGASIIAFAPNNTDPETITIIGVNAIDSSTIQVFFNQPVVIGNANFARIGLPGLLDYSSAAIALSNSVRCDDRRCVWSFHTSSPMMDSTYRLILNPQVNISSISDRAGIVTASDEDQAIEGIQQSRDFAGCATLSLIDDISVLMIDKRTIKMYFPEEMDSGSAANHNNYRITTDADGKNLASTQPTGDGYYDSEDYSVTLYLTKDLPQATSYYLVISSAITNEAGTAKVAPNNIWTTGNIASGTVIEFAASQNAASEPYISSVTADDDGMGLTIVMSEPVAFSSSEPVLSTDSDGTLALNEFPTQSTENMASDFGTAEFTKIFQISGNAVGNVPISPDDIASVERNIDGKTIYVRFESSLESASDGIVTTENDDTTLYMYNRTWVAADKSNSEAAVCFGVPQRP